MSLTKIVVLTLIGCLSLHSYPSSSFDRNITDSDQIIRSLQTNIINGVPSPNVRFFVALRCSSCASIICGGSVVGVRWVLTAAHCVSELETGRIRSDFRIFLGDYTLERGFRRVVHPSRIFVAPGFNQRGVHPTNDIALVKLVEQVRPEKIITLCRSEVDHGTHVRMSGLGATSNKYRIYPKKLLEANFYESKFKSTDIWNMEFCPPYLICVDPITRGTNICFQDDGGPLYTRVCETYQEDCLLGVASFSRRRYLEPCFGGSFFASVPYHYDWIIRTMVEN